MNDETVQILARLDEIETRLTYICRALNAVHFLLRAQIAPSPELVPFDPRPFLNEILVPTYPPKPC